MAELLTIGAVARQIGVARSKLDYAVQKVGIRERGRAGILRLFSHDQIPSMRAALETVRTHHQKEAGTGGHPEGATNAD